MDNLPSLKLTPKAPVNWWLETAFLWGCARHGFSGANSQRVVRLHLGKSWGLMVWWQARRVCEFCLIRMGFLLIPRHPGSPKLRMRVMEPKDYAFWRWLNIPIIIWKYDWMPRGWIDFRSCWRKKQQPDTMFKKEKKNHKSWHFAPPKDGRKVDTNFFVLKFKNKKRPFLGSKTYRCLVMFF